jgi:hypothetical protein
MTKPPGAGRKEIGSARSQRLSQKRGPCRMTKCAEMIPGDPFHDEGWKPREKGSGQTVGAQSRSVAQGG